jgi:hypothetical protein
MLLKLHLFRPLDHNRTMDDYPHARIHSSPRHQVLGASFISMCNNTQSCRTWMNALFIFFLVRNGW